MGYHSVLHFKSYRLPNGKKAFMDSTENFEAEARPKNMRDKLEALPALDDAPETKEEAKTSPESAADASAEAAAAGYALVETMPAAADADATVLVSPEVQAAEAKEVVAEMSETTVMDQASVDPDATVLVSPEVQAAEAMAPVETPEPAPLGTVAEVADLEGLETQVEDDEWPEAAGDVFSDTDVPFTPSPENFSSTPIEQGYETYDSSASTIEEHSGGGAWRVVFGTLVALLVLCGIYAGVALYFHGHFLPNTKVNGEEVSGMAVGDLADMISEIGESYSIHVSGLGIDHTISAADIDFVYDGEAYAKQAQDQIPNWAWLLEIANTHDITVNEATTYSAEKLDLILNNLVGEANKGATPPTNASMAYDATGQQFVPVSEALGTEIELQSVIDTANEAVMMMQTEAVLDDSDLVQPTITTEDERITSGVNHANTLLNSNFTMRIAGNDVMGIEKDLMASWLYLDANCNLEVNPELVKAWTQGPLSEFLDTIGSKRTYTRPDGKVIDVEGGYGDSAYGWLLDGEALANELVVRLKDINVEPFEIPMKKSAAVWTPHGQEWPARYIDVDLSEQYVRMYDESSNLIWEAPCVSGNPVYGGGTDPGVYYIYDKESPTVLVGLDYDRDGQPDYRTDVTYWMPFDGGEGLHDAGWRGSFGGSIYTYDGSHGCVNLPYYSAQSLYGITVVGDVVVVHW